MLALDSRLAWHSMTGTEPLDTPLDVLCTLRAAIPEGLCVPFPRGTHVMHVALVPCMWRTRVMLLALVPYMRLSFHACVTHSSGILKTWRASPSSADQRGSSLRQATRG